MTPMQALATLEGAVRQMQLKADDHDKLKEAVKVIFDTLKTQGPIEEAPKPA